MVDHAAGALRRSWCGVNAQGSAGLRIGLANAQQRATKVRRHNASRQPAPGVRGHLMQRMSIIVALVWVQAPRCVKPQEVVRARGWGRTGRSVPALGGRAMGDRGRSGGRCEIGGRGVSRIGYLIGALRTRFSDGCGHDADGGAFDVPVREHQNMGAGRAAAVTAVVRRSRGEWHRAAWGDESR